MYVEIALNVTRTVNQMHHDKMKCVPDRGFKVFYNRRYFLNFRRYLKN